MMKHSIMSVPAAVLFFLCAVATPADARRSLRHATLVSAVIVSLTLSLTLTAFAADKTSGELDAGDLDKATAEKAFPSTPPYSPYAGRNYPMRPLFGDTHLHTSQSFDAISFGTRLGPEEAYRFTPVTPRSGKGTALP